MPSLILSRKKNKIIASSKQTSRVFCWTKRFFMGLGVTVFIMTIFSLFLVYDFIKERKSLKPLPPSFFLVKEISGSMPEFNRGGHNIILNILSPSSSRQSLYSFIHTLAVAKKDDRVRGIVVFLYDGEYSLTQIETLRRTILDFRDSGKKTYVYADSFGGFSNGMAEYWLASAFDEIWVQPIGDVSLNGIRVEQPYAGEVLDKLGVKPKIIARKEYKTAPEYMTRKDMSPESRETLVAIAEDILRRMLVDIHKSRGILLNDLEEVIDHSPLSVEQALEKGLIDKIGYQDELNDRMQDHINDNNEGKIAQDESRNAFVAVWRYVQNSQQKNRENEESVKVAIVTIDGIILKNRLPSDNFMADNMPDAEDIALSIMKAADDDDIKVILLRINSPGGSPTASETIRRAVVYAKKKGKYVIASMGDVAASGGYWITVDANQIIASDLTLTGSIGVYGGKVNLSGLWDKIGVKWDAVEYGKNASMWSPNTGYNNDSLERLSVMMDEVYEAFVSRVAEGRKMSRDAVEKIAKGRAWTGKAARNNGLVDLNGGLDFALKRAAGEADINDWLSMKFRILPEDEEEDPLEDLLSLLGIKSVTQRILPQPLKILQNEVMKALYYPQLIVTAPNIQISY